MKESATDVLVAELRAIIADLRSDRDAWHDEAERLALPAPQPQSKPLVRAGGGYSARSETGLVLRGLLGTLSDYIEERFVLGRKIAARLDRDGPADDLFRAGKGGPGNKSDKPVASPRRAAVIAGRTAGFKCCRSRFVACAFVELSEHERRRRELVDLALDRPNLFRR